MAESTSNLSILETSILVISSLLAFSLAPSSTPTSERPEKAEDVHSMVRQEVEEEKLAKEQEGLTVPEGEPRPALIIVMGPASCGKSTVGSNLAAKLHLPFIDGDSLHPISNVQKMSSGVPLDDADRLPWLALIRSTAERVCREEFVRANQTGEGQDWRSSLGRPAVVIACSALKKWYRDILRGQVAAEPPTKDDIPPPPSSLNSNKQSDKPATCKLDTYFVYCKGSRELLQQRISARKNHFMGAQMLDSQLATLQDPTGEVGVSIVDIGQEPEDEGKQAVEGVLAMCRK